jgi:hypothetical protein
MIVVVSYFHADVDQTLAKVATQHSASIRA